MSKLVPWLIAGIVITGCALSDNGGLQEPEVKEAIATPKSPKYSQGELLAAELQFRDYMALNFGETSWYPEIKSYGVSSDATGKVVLGIITTLPKSHEHLQMPITLWIANYAPVTVHELWFLYEGELVHRVKW